ncbi:DgyrCDS9292 [Dimorphilus gyrociliatus]|uniref:DNA helicase n=1 Tax=Dimorphilus gyrociliatus TaxID=2664684 RepID=A0A7I8VZ79_9ANNE|nr:DgyrCDS9292 [Dimorphilus gyrociliatus]
MADFDWGFGGDEDDFDEEGGDFRAQPVQRDGLILLIDCSKAMFTVRDEGSFFSQAINCAVGAARNKIVSNDRDMFGVVFYSTKETKNPNDFKNISVVKNLEQPGADTVSDLEKFIEDEDYEEFKDNYGSSDTYQLSDAFWTCSNLFSNCSTKLGQRRILLFTSDDDPSKGNKHFKNSAAAKAGDMSENKIDIMLIPMITSTTPFDEKKFWKDVLVNLTDDSEEFIANAAQTRRELENVIRSKAHKQRAQTKLSLNLGGDVELSVGVYNLIRTCTKPSAIKLYNKTNEELKTTRKAFLEETGEVLLPQDMKKSLKFADRQICFEPEEINEMKRYGDVGMFLLGFKPMKYLKKDYHVRPAQFIYPDEGGTSGSTNLFSALLRRCLKRNVFALCRFTARKNAFPRFVALVPQEEERDEQGVQQVPSGFHAIFLPFSDDFRKIKAVEDPITANSDQVEAAKQLISSLNIPFQLDMIENPALQTHFANVEAIALDRDMPDKVTDLTKPDVGAMMKRASKALKEFGDLLFPSDYTPGARKRGGPPAKRPKVDPEEMARNGALGKLTVAILKEICAEVNVKPKGTKKADIIDALNKHFGV